MVMPKNLFEREQTRKKMSETRLKKFREGFINPFQGLHHTKETKRILSLKSMGRPSGNKGNKYSEETRNRMKIIRKGRTWDDIFGKETAKRMKKNMGRISSKRMKNIVFSEETIEKMSVAGKLKVKEGRGSFFKKGNKYCLTAVETQSKKGFISKPERIIKQLLPEDFIHSKRLGNIGVPDFHSPQRKIVVEVDGDYWHSKPEAIKRDTIKNKYWKRMGYNIFRIPEQDVNKYFKPLTRGLIKDVL